MAQHNIEKWDPAYALLKPFVKLHFRGYFKKIHILGREHIPRDVPVIFAPNHHNALMDALAVLYALPGQPVFLARSDIFSNPLIARILTFLKLLPIYRIRDGYGSLQQNERILDKVSDVLAKKKSLVIFPEGNHAAERRLRPLKKGISRIAFQAEERHNFQLGLQVVPVGLDYDNFYKFHRSLVIRFGRPVSVDPFEKIYRENPSKANIALKNEIARQLKQEMVHIASKPYHDMINELREIYRPRLKEHLNGARIDRGEQLEIDQPLIRVCESKGEKNPNEAARLDKQVKMFRRIAGRLDFRYWVFRQKRYSWFTLAARLPLFILFLPVFLYGLVNNALPFFLPVLAIRPVKDPQFWSSIKNGLAILLFSLFYLLQTLVVASFTDGLWQPLGYLLSLPMTGYLAYFYYAGVKKWWARIRYNILWLTKPRLMEKIRALRKDIIQTSDSWWQEENS
jgi:1-acyl-sn-glycerol-3-phosphate acyltransferase